MEVLRCNNVFDIVLYNSERLFLISNSEFKTIGLKSKELTEDKIETDFFGGNIRLFENGSCQAMTMYGITYIYEYKKFNALPYTINVKADNLLYVELNSEEIIEYKLLNIENQILWSTKKGYTINFLNDNYLFRTFKNESINNANLNLHTALASINIENGNDIWVKNVPSKYDRLNEDNEKFPIFYGEINNLFGVVDGILWLSLLSGQLCGIDADTGDFIHEFGGLHLQSELRDIDKTIFEYGSTFLMKESKKVISITRNGFIEVDLNTLSMEVFPLDLPEAYDKKIIRNADLIDDDYLSFYNHQSSFYGIYNIKEKKVELIDTLRDDDGEEVALKRFRATEDYFFFLERHFYGVPERNGILKVIAR